RHTRSLRDWSSDVCSSDLLVLYDPDLLPRADLVALIAAHWPPPDGAAGSLRRWRVPVHYGGAHGADLDDLAAGAGLSPEAVIARSEERRGGEEWRTRGWPG